MNIKPKISAFTLSEMIVVIILTSIVVGMAFSVLSLVQKHMHSIQNNFNKNTELNKLEQSLWIDFNRYSKVRFEMSQNRLFFYNEMDSTSYDFTGTSIIKERDTFNIALRQKTLYFDGDKVQKGYTDAIKLELSEAFQNQTLFVFKRNDATPFINIFEAN